MEGNQPPRSRGLWYLLDIRDELNTSNPSNLVDYLRQEPELADNTAQINRVLDNTIFEEQLRMQTIPQQDPWMSTSNPDPDAPVRSLCLLESFQVNAPLASGRGALHTAVSS